MAGSSYGRTAVGGGLVALALWSTSALLMLAAAFALGYAARAFREKIAAATRFALAHVFRRRAEW